MGVAELDDDPLNVSSAVVFCDTCRDAPKVRNSFNWSASVLLTPTSAPFSEQRLSLGFGAAHFWASVARADDDLALLDRCVDDLLFVLVLPPPSTILP